MLRIGNRLALRIGQVLLAGFVLGPAVGIWIAIHDSSPPHPTWVKASLIVGAPVLCAAFAAATMLLHQSTIGLSRRDRRGWRDRLDPDRPAGGFPILVPFFYLLGGRRQRRLRTYLDPRSRR